MLLRILTGIITLLIFLMEVQKGSVYLMKDAEKDRMHVEQIIKDKNEEARSELD
jgi:hypothetical protein